MLANKKIPLTYLLGKIYKDLVIILFLSVGIHIITTNFQHHWPTMPLSIPTFIGASISILLSFKLNQSYERWWEARKIWGSIVNDSRSLMIQIKTLGKNISKQEINTIGELQILWCYTLANSLRDIDSRQLIQDAPIPSEIKNNLMTSTNVPLKIQAEIADRLRILVLEGKIELLSQLEMDKTIVRNVESQGKAERIKTTVFPSTYRIFLKGMIYIFVITLGIGLEDVGGIFEIPLMLLISSVFFSLEKTAVHMQDPFENRPTDTAMNTISRKIEINIKELCGYDDLPKPLQAEKFYSL